MKRKATNTILCVVFFTGLIFSAILPVQGYAAEQVNPPPIKIIDGLEFETYEIGDMIVYFHQRTIGEAVVEKDYIVYQYDRQTGKLIKKIVNWRENLPDVLPEDMIAREQAESMVQGKVLFSRLYFISPESIVHQLEWTPNNPCWVVWSENENKGPVIISIIDAVGGNFLGNGVSPPFTAFSLTGPRAEIPCASQWDDWYQNAATWLDSMGYSTETAVWPTEETIQGHIQSTDTAMFYEIGHSQHTPGDLFTSGCVDGYSYEVTTATEVSSWMYGYSKMPFTFLASCYGMCETGWGKLSYEFRKGSVHDTATVGYCGMTDPPCDYCWTVSFSWQDTFFNYLSLGWTVKDAFDQTIADMPMCFDCIRFAGDEHFAIVPLVTRDYPSYLHFFFRRFVEWRRVFPPDPVVRRFLDRAEMALNRAMLKSLLGDMLGSLQEVSRALIFIQKAGARGNVDTSDKLESLVSAAGRMVRAEIEAAENIDWRQNNQIWIAWRINDQAMLMLERGRYHLAMQLFRTAYRLVMKYSHNQERPWGILSQINY